MNRLRRAFCPTREERISDFEMLLRMHREQIGHCSTCTNYVSSNMPGFVTDYGKCKAEAEIFPDKVCGLTGDPCHSYVEDTEFEKDISLKIQQLQKQDEGART